MITATKMTDVREMVFGLTIAVAIMASLAWNSSENAASLSASSMVKDFSRPHAVQLWNASADVRSADLHRISLAGAAYRRWTEGDAASCCRKELAWSR